MDTQTIHRMDYHAVDVRLRPVFPANQLGPRERRLHITAPHIAPHQSIDSAGEMVFQPAGWTFLVMWRVKKLKFIVIAFIYQTGNLNKNTVTELERAPRAILAAFLPAQPAEEYGDFLGGIFNPGLWCKLLLTMMKTKGIIPLFLFLPRA